ncbi:hypothetical protein SGPA1_11531 [Streptomyces misionensis JCM 4497]
MQPFRLLRGALRCRDATKARPRTRPALVGRACHPWSDATPRTAPCGSPLPHRMRSGPGARTVTSRDRLDTLRMMLNSKRNRSTVGSVGFIER